MLSIQIISLIIFVAGIVVMPVIDQLFFYRAFNFKGGLKDTVKKEQKESKEFERVDFKTSEVKNDNNNETNEIPEIKEDRGVEKRKVETGETRLRSKIIERPVEESVRLREDHVSVERTTVDRPATAMDFENFEEKGLQMVELGEVHMIGEISIVKEVEEKSEAIKDPVSNPEANVGNSKK